MRAPESGCPVHLLPADDSLDALRREGTYVAVCEALLPAGSLPPWECPEGPQGCDCDLFCLECVRRAAEYTGLLAERVGGAR